MSKIAFKSRVGHRMREFAVHTQRIAQPATRPRVLVFPGGPPGTGMAADLRGWAITGSLRRLGWRATAVPPQLEQLQRERIVRMERPDVVLLQQSRHPLNRPRFFPGIPCVFDADDADVLDPRCTENVLECCQESRAVIAGSRFLAETFRPHNPEVRVVWTGTYLPVGTGQSPPERRAPVVAWAHSSPLGYPQEAELVREILLGLAKRTKFTFFLYGVSNSQAAEEYLEPIRQAGVLVRTFPLMPYRRFAQTLNEVAVGLHPVCLSNPFSRGKSFGKLLAYLAADVAIVASDAVDHPRFFRHGENGLLAGDDPGPWIEHCASLLEDQAARARIASQGQSDLRQRLTTARAAELVDKVLAGVLDQTRTSMPESATAEAAPGALLEDLGADTPGESTQ